MKTQFIKNDLLTRGVEEIIEKKGLLRKINSGKKLRVKFGIDPTGPNIHLGHTVALWKLRQLQEFGHTVVLIMGDFTATIGDPSGQKIERQALNSTEIHKNMKRYIEQVAKILDIKKIEINYNSQWHTKEGLSAMLKLTRTATVQQLTKRADFKKRLEEGGDITVVELLYPLLQAYDSVKVRADIEVGGTDQKFNLLMGRQVQQRFGQPAQDVIMLPLLRGTDGVKKMSKSYHNYISLLDKPKEMFGKIMSIYDNEIVEYFELATPLPFQELQGLKKQKMTGTTARDAKLHLAHLITSFYWGTTLANKAQKHFETVFQKRQPPKKIRGSKRSASRTLRELLVEVGFAVSKSEAQRLIEQGGVYADNERIKDPSIFIKKGTILRVGKRKMIKIT